MNAEFQHFMAKAADAMRGGYDAWAVQSTGERVAVAVVLNRPDWLALTGYTITEALQRMGPEWVNIAPLVANALRDECAGAAQLWPQQWLNAGIEQLGQAAQTLREESLR